MLKTRQVIDWTLKQDGHRLQLPEGHRPTLRSAITHHKAKGL